MKVWYNKGIHVIIDGKHLLFDPIGHSSADVELVFVSHGHSDHASGLNTMKDEDIIIHPATLEYKRDNVDKSNDIKLVVDGGSLRYRNLEIEAYRSAHCLGSLQFKIKGDEGTVVFTGDLNLSGSYIEPPAKVLKGDVLIIEANFGNPNYIFPKRMKVCGDLVNWIMNYKGKKPIILFSHALGKAQELTQLLNDCNLIADHGQLLMNGLALSSNIIFEKYRYKFKKRYRRYNPSIDLQKNDILLYPIREKISAVSLAKVKRNLRLFGAAFAHISGWTLHQPGNYNFPLSSHSGYDELMRYVEESGAKTVYTFHGHSETFSKCVNKKGIKAAHITPESSYY